MSRLLSYSHAVRSIAGRRLVPDRLESLMTAPTVSSSAVGYRRSPGDVLPLAGVMKGDHSD